MKMLRDDLEQYSSELTGAIGALPFAHLVHAADWLLECHRRGGTIFIAGNGGSAATASHFACDLAKGTYTPGLPAFRVIPLTDNVPLLTAWANDTSYERVFAEQLAALVRPGDVVVLISASGNSANVLAAAQTAREAGAAAIALTGQRGGRLAARADLSIRVHGQSVEQVEDLHLIIAHSLCVALRARLRAEAELRQGMEREKGAARYDISAAAAPVA